MDYAHLSGYGFFILSNHNNVFFCKTFDITLRTLVNV